MSSTAASSSVLKSDGFSTIDDLPDDVVSHILTMLPIEAAVATSVVSKKWETLWHGAQNLDFKYPHSAQYPLHEEEVRRRNLFASFVRNVLQKVRKIEKLSIEIDDLDSDYFDVRGWVEIAVGKKVIRVFECRSELYGSFALCPIELPTSLFTCRTLEVLVLTAPGILSVPSLIELPNVKTLELVAVRFQSEESLRNLIRGCSSLETLNVHRHYHDNMETFAISSTTLRNLTFIFGYDDTLTGFHQKLDIHAPSLVYFNLQDDLSSEFSVGNFPSLEKAHVDTRAPFGGDVDEDVDVDIDEDDHHSQSVVKLLQGLYNVKHLLLGLHTLQDLGEGDLTPEFHRLTQLTVHVNCCNWSSLMKLIECSNNLESLIILKEKEDSGHIDMNGTCWSEPENVPACLSSLTKLSWERLRDHEYDPMVAYFQEDDLAMIAYFLKNAEVMSELTVKAFKGGFLYEKSVT